MGSLINAKTCQIYFEALLNDTGCFMSPSVNSIILSTIEHLKESENDKR